MGAEEALEFADRLVFTATGEHLDDLTCRVFEGAWAGKTYDQIATALGYEESYIRDVGASLFKQLGRALGEGVSKSNFKAALERCASSTASSTASTSLPTQPPDLNFMGRASAIATLHNLVQQGARLILIQGEGGLGKTTLARKYLDQPSVGCLLELWMPTEAETITPAESVVEEWLRRSLNEEPGQEFGINLERLRRRLRTAPRPVGILIDNLESALDGMGRFLPSRRSYVELLRVLADSSINAVTLITSRERLHEVSVNVQLYPLESLDETAWLEFFQHQNLTIDTPALTALYHAYGGNAKAMKILSGIIAADFEGDLNAYWQAHCDNLLVERELTDLVSTQLNRLQQIDPAAYRLLCRLSCYRYQEISHVSRAGVFCLMWDIPAVDQAQVLRSLQDRSLIEVRQGRKFWLHPMIRAQAIGKLRESPDWPITNQVAAEFWTSSVTVVETVDDALRALEAYYHYLEIGNCEQACDVILGIKNSQWGEEVPLGWLFYRFGLLQQMVAAINRIIDNVTHDQRSGALYNLLGYIHRLAGNMQKAMTCHQSAGQIATEFNHPQLKISTLLNLGLCQKDLWEMDAAIEKFQLIYQLTQSSAHEHPEYFIYSQCCLAYLFSCIKQKTTAHTFIEQVNVELLLSRLTAWGKSYCLMYLAAAYRNLGQITSAFELYRQTMVFSERNHFTQIKANALHGMAQLYREQQTFDLALNYHIEAIELLNKIGAKCDLAEAHCQLGVTYQVLHQADASRLHFYQAVQLFGEISAPKQVARVRKIIAADPL
jgi:tetratricopeptide (TPR) repeat protein